MSRLLHAGRMGERHTLQAVARRELGIDLDKAEQKSDWSGRLTAAQLEYAAVDVLHLRPLRDKLLGQLDAAGLTRVAEIENACLPAWVWMAGRGVAVNREGWLALAAEAEEAAAALRQRMDAEAPPQPGTFAGLGAWNWNSSEEVKQVFALLGCRV